MTLIRSDNIASDNEVKTAQSDEDDDNFQNDTAVVKVSLFKSIY